jgi:hypothetical protein
MSLSSTYTGDPLASALFCLLVACLAYCLLDPLPFSLRTATGVHLRNTPPVSVDEHRPCALLYFFYSLLGYPVFVV